jgi:O-antigen/teichoic acid export membrane protein
MESTNRHPPGEARFFSNTIALVGYTVIGTVLTLAQVKLLAGSLSKETFGLFASLRGFSLLIATISAHGIPALLVRFLPVHEANGNRRSALGLSAASLVLTLAPLCLVLFVAYAFRMRLLAFVPAGDVTGALLVWFGVMTLGATFKLVVYAGLNGLRRLVHQVVLETLSILAVLIWIYLRRANLGIVDLLEMFGVVSLATICVAVPILFFFLGRTRSGTGGSERGRVSYRHDYVTYWYGALGLSLVAVAFTDFDRYLLSQIVTLEMLALFHIGSRIMKLANRLLSVPNLAFQPEITRLNEEGRNERVETSTRVLIKFNTALSMFIMLMILSFSREIITMVTNREYLGVLPVLTILCLSLPLSTITAPITTVMKALDQVRGALYCDLGWALVYVSLLFTLGMRFGIIGVGVAHLCACLIQLALSIRISRLEIRSGFVCALAAKLGACGVAAFAPLLALAIAAGRGGAASGWFTVGKCVLAPPAFIVFQRVVRRAGILDAGERSMLRDMFARRGMSVLSRLFT